MAVQALFTGNNLREGRMSTVECAYAAALLALAVAIAPAHADEAVRATHAGADPASRACLNQKERRTLVENGTVLHLASAMHAVRSHVPGTLIRARLCRRGDGLVYVLTVLAHDGKVTRVAVDAAKGTLVGER
jgi:uncharacterized membrane protein YkoI